MCHDRVKDHFSVYEPVLKDLHNKYEVSCYSYNFLIFNLADGYKRKTFDKLGKRQSHC